MTSLRQNTQAANKGLCNICYKKKRKMDKKEVGWTVIHWCKLHLELSRESKKWFWWKVIIPLYNAILHRLAKAIGVSSSQSHLSDESCALLKSTCLSFPAAPSHCLEKLTGHVASFKCNDGLMSSAAGTVFLHGLRCEDHILITSTS